MQRKLSNGKWHDESKGERVQMFIEDAAKFNGISTEEVVRRLDAGETLSHGTDWYDRIRNEPAPKTPRAISNAVQCSCGHTVPATMVMSTSNGTSCARCYDAMSE